MRRKAKCSVLIALSAMLLGCGADANSAGVGCASDDDCKGARICADGVCVGSLEEGSSTQGDGGQLNAFEGGLGPEGGDLPERGDEMGPAPTDSSSGSPGVEVALDAGGPAIDGPGPDSVTPMDAGVADGANASPDPFPVDSPFAFPVGACAPGFECVEHPIFSILEDGMALCVRPGSLAPPSCDTDADCADLNVECFDMAATLPLPPPESMGLDMTWCALRCDGHGTQEEDEDDADSGVGPGDDDDALCSNTCRFASDGDCDDCGPGSDYSLCDLGTDCNDCGPRSSTDTCDSGGNSSSSTVCNCSCNCSGCTTQTTRTCSGISNTDCLSCTAVCQDVCTSDPYCGSYLSSSGGCF